LTRTLISGRIPLKRSIGRIGTLDLIQQCRGVKEMEKATLLSIFLTAGVLCGQTVNGTLTGIILDPAQAVVPNAKVSARNQATGVTTQTVTSTEGVYTLSLRPAVYGLTVEASGFKTLERTGLKSMLTRASGLT